MSTDDADTTKDAETAADATKDAGERSEPAAAAPELSKTEAAPADEADKSERVATPKTDLGKGAGQAAASGRSGSVPGNRAIRAGVGCSVGAG
ncbi:hypothetical protein [Nocardia brasiliensis]|uniref:hypothetical protein n=1 Tax=Nocardia brasiliensis TaxID=37326 RepID=UPI002455A683|nr:hypothetical protein [Nocardia brasiliensis]